MSNSSGITISTWRLAAIFNFVKKRYFRSWETLRLFTGNKGGHSEHILRSSALYIFSPFQNLKFLYYYPYLKPHTLFFSNGLAIWHSFSDIMHLIKLIMADSRPFLI